MKVITSFAVALLAATALARGPAGPNVPNPTPLGGVRIQGIIESIDPALQQITVDGHLVQITSTTVLRMRNQPISFADLGVGQTVTACGVLEEGVLVAWRLTVNYGGTVAVAASPAGWAMPEGPNPNPGVPLDYCVRIEGVITAIHADSRRLEVAGTFVQVTDTTRIRLGKDLISFEDLVVGQTVAVGGAMDGDVLVANRITVKYQGA